MRPLALLVATVLPGACAEATRPPSVAWDSAGVRIVESRAPIWDETDRWTIAESAEITIGAESGPPELQFNRINEVWIASDGSVLVADENTPGVRYFNMRGEYVRTVGRSGAGPGEFNEIGGFVLLPGDTLIAFDRVLERLTVFDQEGGVIATNRMVPSPVSGHMLVMYKLGGLADSRLILFPSGFIPVLRPTPEVTWETAPNLLYSLAGEFLDSIGEPSGIDMWSSVQGAAAVPFGRHSVATVAEGAVIITDGGGMSVRRYDGEGELRSISRVVLPARITTEEDRARMREYMHGTVPIADRMPWIGGIVAGEDGEIWVQEYRVFYSQDPGRWYVLDSNGHWLGIVEGPSQFRLTNVSGGLVWGVWRGEDDVETIRAYRVRRGT